MAEVGPCRVVLGNREGGAEVGPTGLRPTLGIRVSASAARVAILSASRTLPPSFSSSAST
jgi:hypothetical protein